jgi:hypothetical protein
MRPAHPRATRDRRRSIVHINAFAVAGIKQAAFLRLLPGIMGFEKSLVMRVPCLHPLRPALFHPPLKILRGDLIRPFKQWIRWHKNLHFRSLIRYFFRIGRHDIRIRTEVMIELRRIVLDDDNTAVPDIGEQAIVISGHFRPCGIGAHAEKNCIVLTKIAASDIGRRQKVHLDTEILERSGNIIAAAHDISDVQIGCNLHIHGCGFISRRRIEEMRPEPAVSRNLVAFPVLFAAILGNRGDVISLFARTYRSNLEGRRAILSILCSRERNRSRLGFPARGQVQLHCAAGRAFDVTVNHRRNLKRLRIERHHSESRRDGNADGGSHR